MQRYKRSTLNLSASPAINVLIVLNVVLLIYIPGVAISLVVIADIRGRNACISGDTTVFVWQ